MHYKPLYGNVKKTKQVFLFSKSILSRSRNAPAVTHQLVLFTFALASRRSSGLFERGSRLSLVLCPDHVRSWTGEVSRAAGGDANARKARWQLAPFRRRFHCVFLSPALRERRAARQLRGFSTGVNDSLLFNSNAAAQKERGGRLQPHRRHAILSCFSLLLFRFLFFLFRPLEHKLGKCFFSTGVCVCVCVIHSRSF